MADLNSLAKLFQAIAAQDWDSARAHARAVAEREEQVGHHAAAQRLRGALHREERGVRREPEAGWDSMASGPGTYLPTALTRLDSSQPLTQVRLSHPTKAALLEVVLEWQLADRLKASGLVRRSKLLFHGPPGCGKSFAARAIAMELGVPVYVVRFDAVVGAYLGQTALHLRQLFRFAETTPCVLLIDEVDALGKRRGNPLDVGELDRVVIALLQELEHSRPAGLLIATSNLAKQLDDALWRRFDLALTFPKPSTADLRAFATERAHVRGLSVSRALVDRASRVASYAEAERLLDNEQRQSVLKSSKP